MKKRNIWLLLFLLPFILLGQEKKDKKIFKKKVLESTEIDFLTSLYTQSGNNAAVTGGIGNEDLQDVATDINISIPINPDDVLSINTTISAYTSASSSNLNPFSGASKGENDDEKLQGTGTKITGSPWVASSGASKSDVWISGNIGYTHSSDDRNSLYNSHLSISNEFDYFSFGVGMGMVKLFNQKNTELSLGATIYLDTWRPEYPTEIKTYIKENGNLNADFFNGVPILNQNGNPINKNSSNAWHPQKNELIKNKGRNTYALLMSFSQILTKKLQISIFSDITYQKGWLSNPMQRVYFKDVDNFYIGNPSDISVYTSSENTEVFQLADDIERLPKTRLKIPIGMRFHYYINEFLVLNTYYRYYYDDWGITSNTFNIEIPVKISNFFTLYPNYRFYNQTAAHYFAPYEQHLSTEIFYTSDFDLSAFNANQYGLGIKYSDVLTQQKIWKFKLKNISLNYNYYTRTTGLKAHIISLGTKIIFD